MPTSSGKAPKRGARLARAYIAAAIPAVVILAPVAGRADHRPIRSVVCDVRTIVSPLLGTCATAQPQPQPQPSAQPSANPAPSRPAAQPSFVPSSRAVASGSSAALPPPQADAPAPSPRDEADTPPPPPPPGDVPAATKRGSSPLAVLDVVLAAAMSGGLVWLIALRRRRRQDALIKNATVQVAEVKNVMANFTHEILTPVTAIMLAARMLGGRKIPWRERRRVVDMLNQASKQLERTVDLLTRYAALRGGSLRPRLETLDIAAVARQTAARAGKTNPSRSISVQAASALPFAAADAQLVGEAVHQLVDNALKFSSPSGPVDVFVRPDPTGAGIDIVVRDRGMGIAQDNLERIFEEYTQGDGTSTREFGGVGLGLAFVREVARTHGGVVTVDSVPGAGSTFTLRLPGAAVKPMAVRTHIAAA